MHCVVEVCDRRSSGGFEITSSATEEDKPEPHRSNSGDSEVTSSAVEECKREPNGSNETTVHSHQSVESENKTLEEQSATKEKKKVLDQNNMGENSFKDSSEAENSVVKMISNASSDSEDNNSDIDTEVTRSEKTGQPAQNEGRTEPVESEKVQSSDDVVVSCESSKVTSSTDQVLSAHSMCDNGNETVTPFENEAESVTPVAEDDNSNHSDEMYFDACSTTPEKKAAATSQSENASLMLSDKQEVDSTEQAETKTETPPSSQNDETTVCEKVDSSEPMDTN